MDKQIVFALKGIIVFEGKILIIKRSSKDEFGADTWEIPGGKLDFNESLDEGLKREIKEETNLDVEISKILYATTFKASENRQLVINTYLCKSQTNKIKLSEEHSEYKWLSIEESRNYLIKEIINDFEKNKIFDLNELNI